MHQFQDWYPEWGFIFDRIMQDNCSAEHATYLRGPMNRTMWEESVRWLGSGSSSANVVPLVNCILAYSAEYINSGMSAANVVLGLTPGILASLGSSVEESAVLSVIGGRHFLAFCLSAGSPAVVSLRLFEYRKMAEVLNDHKGRLKTPFFSSYVEATILFTEYLAVLLAIANVADLGYDLGSKVIIIFAPHLTYLILLWIFLGTVPHMVATLAVSLRVRIEYLEHDDRLNQAKIWKLPWAARNMTKFKILPETVLYTFLSGMVTLLVTAHIIFGTLVFSSMLFISVKDSIPIIGRFLASVVVCRIVLMFELARLRQLCQANDTYQLVDQSE